MFYSYVNSRKGMSLFLLVVFMQTTLRIHHEVVSISKKKQKNTEHEDIIDSMTLVRMGRDHGMSFSDLRRDDMEGFSKMGGTSKSSKKLKRSYNDLNPYKIAKKSRENPRPGTLSTAWLVHLVPSPGSAAEEPAQMAAKEILEALGKADRDSPAAGGYPGAPSYAIAMGEEASIGTSCFREGYHKRVP